MNSKDQIHYDIAELLEKIAHLNIKLAGTEKIHPVELDLLRSYLRELDKLADSMPLMQLPKPSFGLPKQEAQPSTLPSFDIPSETSAVSLPLVEETTEPVKAPDITDTVNESEPDAPVMEELVRQENDEKVADAPGIEWNLPSAPQPADEPDTNNDWERGLAEEEKMEEPETAAEEEEDLDIQETAASTEPEATPHSEKAPENETPPHLFFASHYVPDPAAEMEQVTPSVANDTPTADEVHEQEGASESPIPNRADEPEAEEPEPINGDREPWVASTTEEPAGQNEGEPEPKFEPNAPASPATSSSPPEGVAPAPNTEEPVKRSLNDLFNKGESQDLGSRFQFQNRKNLREMIDLSERYVFTKELFGGDADYYDRAIRQLNQFETLAEAQAYMQNELRPKYHWEGKEQVEKQFAKIVERRFA